MRTRRSRKEGDASPLASLPVPTRRTRKAPAPTPAPAPAPASAPASPAVSKTKRARESSTDRSVDSASKRIRLETPTSQKPSPKHLSFATERVKSPLVPSPSAGQGPSSDLASVSEQTPTQSANTRTPIQASRTRTSTQATYTSTPKQADRTRTPTQAAQSQTPTQAARTQTPTQGTAEASSHTSFYTPTKSFHSAQREVRNDVSQPHILEGDDSTFLPDDESTPASTHGLFGMLQRLPQPRPMFRRRNFDSQTTPVNNRPHSSLPFTAPPVTNTTVLEDFAGLLPQRMTPRPYALKNPMFKPHQSARQPARQPSREPERDVEDEDDDDASIHEDDIPSLTKEQIRQNLQLLRKVNLSCGEYKRNLKNYEKESGFGLLKKTDPKEIVINIREKVEKIIEVPGSSMPAEFPSNTLVIPASNLGDQMILTDPRIIELARAAAIYLTSDPAHQLPNPGQMTEILQRFNETGAVDSLDSDISDTSDTNTADRFDSLVTNQNNYPNHDQSDMSSSFHVGRTYDENHNEVPYQIAMTNAFGAHEEQSEVEGPVSSPFIATPAQLSNNLPSAATATSDVNRGFFSSIKNMFSSPMKKIGIIPDTPRGSTTTADVHMGDLTPATITRFGVSPSTDIDFSPTGLRDPKSPTPHNKRARKQRKAKRQNSSNHKGQHKHAQRMQDELNGGDIHREEREKRRVEFATSDEFRIFQANDSSQLSATSPSSTSPKDKGGFGVPQTIPDDWNSDDEDPSLVKLRAENPPWLQKWRIEHEESMKKWAASEAAANQNIDSHTDESVPSAANSYDSQHHGSQKRRHDGSRIDSHYDKSSTSQNVGHVNSGSQTPTTHLNSSHHHGLPEPQQNGSRIDSHYDESSTSQNVGSQTGSRIDSHHDESSTTQTVGSLAPTDPDTPVRQSGTYSVPDTPSDDESDEDETTSVPVEEGGEEVERAAVLAEKQNEQAVPAPPRPANAVLPPPYDKYVPKKSSFLSFTENMSPLQVEVEKENHLDPWEAADEAASPEVEVVAGGEEWVEKEDELMKHMSREVLEAVDSLF